MKGLVPCVSVIIPTFNRYTFLKKAVLSVLHQSFTDLELLVVDDGSNDETGTFMQSLDDERVHYTFQENKGVSAARNVGIKKAGGRYLAFLDSDDWWVEEKLEKQIHFMAKNPCQLSHTQEIWYRHGKILHQKKKHRKQAGDLFEKSLDMCSISMSTVLIEKSLFDQVGLFDETLPACEDYDMWLKVTSKNQIGLLDEDLTLKDGGRPDQLSFRIKMLDRYRIKAISNLLQTKTLSLEQTQLAKKVLIKKCQIYSAGCIKHGREEEAVFYEKILKEHLTIQCLQDGLRKIF